MAFSNTKNEKREIFVRVNSISRISTQPHKYSRQYSSSSELSRRTSLLMKQFIDIWHFKKPNSLQPPLQWLPFKELFSKINRVNHAAKASWETEEVIAATAQEPELCWHFNEVMSPIVWYPRGRRPQFVMSMILFKPVTLQTSFQILSFSGSCKGQPNQHWNLFYRAPCLC